MVAECEILEDEFLGAWGGEENSDEMMSNNDLYARSMVAHMVRPLSWRLTSLCLRPECCCMAG